jgi:hypothetical protein
VLHEPDEVLELDGVGPQWWEGPGQERCRGGADPAGRPGAGQGDGVEAPWLLPGQAAGHEVAGVERLQGMVDDDPRAGPDGAGGVVGQADGAVDDVEQLADGDGRGPFGVGPLVTPAVGDDQVALGGQERVEEELSVLAAGVAVADAGIGRHEVVVVDVDLAGEHAVVEPEEADDPVGDRPHRDQGADREMPGAEVGPGRVAPQPVGQQGADLRQCQFGTGGRPALRLGHDVVEKAAQLGGLPGVGRAGGGEQGGGPGQRVGPSADGLGSGERIEGGGEPVEQLGQAAGEVDVAAAHVVDRQHPADQPLPLVGHGHAEQEPVEAGPPRVGVEGAEFVGGPVGGIEAPPDPGRGHPLLGPREVVAVEPEPAPDRLPAGQVEHLGGGDPGRGQGEQLRHHPQHRVGLAQRPVGEPDPQVDPGRARAGAACAVRRRGTGSVGVVAGSVESFGGTERGVDQRGERLDVGTHHDDVAGFQRGIGGQEVEDGIPHDFHLPAPAMAGVDGQAGVTGVEGRPVVAPCQRQAGRGPVTSHVGLDSLQERAFGRLDRMVVVNR